MGGPHSLGQPVAARSMRGAALAVSLCGLAVVVGGLLAGRAAWDSQPVDVPDQNEVQVPEVAPITARPKPVASARAVAPDVVAIPPIAPEALVRVDPRHPLSPFGQPLPPKPKDNSRIQRPLADAAGRFIGDGLLINIAGVLILDPDETCPRVDGPDWPCGMRARTAFRGLLRGRAVTCNIPPDFEGKSIDTACSLGKLDLGGWIVANGWGRAVPGSPYAESGEAARSAEKGIYGPGPVELPPLIELTPELSFDQ